MYYADEEPADTEFAILQDQCKAQPSHYVLGMHLHL